MDKGKTCNTCRKLNESINELGRCEPCQATVEKTYIERLRRKNERRKQERLDNPEKFRDKEKRNREANLEKIKLKRLYQLGRPRTLRPFAAIFAAFQGNECKR